MTAQVRTGQRKTTHQPRAKKSKQAKYQQAWRMLRTDEPSVKSLVPIGPFQFFLLCGVAWHPHGTCYQAELTKWAERERGKPLNPGHVAGALKILVSNRYLKHRMAAHPTARRKDVNLYSLTRRGQLVLNLIIELLVEEATDRVH